MKTDNLIINSELLLPKTNDGNIPIQQELLNKYTNVNEIFDNEYVHYGKVINIKNNNFLIDIKNATHMYHSAVKIFNSNHKTNYFHNNKSIIYVTN